MGISLSDLPVELILQFLIPKLSSTNAIFILSNNNLVRTKGWKMFKNFLDVKDLFIRVYCNNQTIHDWKYGKSSTKNKSEVYINEPISSIALRIFQCLFKMDDFDPSDCDN